MKVHQLIAILEEQDGDAEVLIMSQQTWPFEVALHGVVIRADMEGGDEEDEEGHDDAGRARGDGTSRTDVFLVEGRQLRYGSKTAWNVAITA
jgi:hypothetical protein